MQNSEFQGNAASRFNRIKRNTSPTTTNENENSLVEIQFIDSLRIFLRRAFERAFVYWSKEISEVKDSLNLKIIQMNSLASTTALEKTFSTYNISNGSPLFIIAAGIGRENVFRNKTIRTPVSFDELFHKQTEGKVVVAPERRTAFPIIIPFESNKISENGVTKVRETEFNLEDNYHVDIDEDLKQSMEFSGIGNTVMALFSKASQIWFGERIESLKSISVRIIGITELEDSKSLQNILTSYNISSLRPLLLISAGMKASSNAVTMGIQAVPFEELQQGFGTGPTDLFKLASMIVKNGNLIDDDAETRKLRAKMNLSMSRRRLLPGNFSIY